jgi:integrase
MASIKILLKNQQTDKQGLHPIILQIIHERQKRIISLRHNSRLEHWDPLKGLPNARHPNSSRLSILIRNTLNQADKIILELENDNKPFTVDDIITKLRSKSSNVSFFDFTDDFIKKLVIAGKIGNSTVYQSTLNAFKKFRNNKDLTFNQLSYRIIKDFEASLLERKIKINTISLYLRTLRAIYNHAIKVRVAQQSLYPFKEIRIKSESTSKRALTKEDISKIRALELESGSELDKARDYFLFSFNMRGMSFVDMAFLKNSYIVNDRLQYSRQKTGQRISIKLTQEASAIINKLSYSKKPEDFILPIIDRKDKEYLDYQNAIRLTNKKLKLIGEMAKCSIRVSTYVSRHSWATIAKRAGVPTAVISEGLGHDSEKTTQIYLDSFENRVLDDANDLVTS